jgi:hypothetical protein
MGGGRSLCSAEASLEDKIRFDYRSTVQRDESRFPSGENKSLPELNVNLKE